MNKAIQETRKRISILDDIREFIEVNDIKIDSSRVGGSMSFAKNFAIKPPSDIDLDIFISFSGIKNVKPLLSFLNADAEFLKDNDWSEVDLISTDGRYNGVDINIWIFDSEKFYEIAELKREYISYYTLHKPTEVKTHNIFGGGTCKLDREVKQYKDGYLSKRFILYKGELISENYVLNNMFFVSPIFGKEYSDLIVDKMWIALKNMYPDATSDQVSEFLIENVKDRFSPEY